MKVLFYDDPRCEAHDQGEGHPESPERVRAIRQAVLNDTRLKPELEPRPARMVTRAELLRFHSPEYIGFVEQTCLDHAPAVLGTDVSVSRGSWSAACLAAGGAIAATAAVLAGEAKRAFCNLRPPGHHARSVEAMGFCIFNNVVLAAKAALAAGLERVAVVDWDVHHGNGTQEAFYQDPAVLYCSLHQHPFYPGTGALGLRGAEPAEGLNVNVPLAPGTSAGAYRQAFSSRVLPALDAFEPELVLVSCGFDAHLGDPLAELCLEAGDYAWMTTQLADLAKAHAQGRLVSVLEGGYFMEALRTCAPAHLRALAALPEA